MWEITYFIMAPGVCGTPLGGTDHTDAGLIGLRIIVPVLGVVDLKSNPRTDGSSCDISGFWRPCLNHYLIEEKQLLPDNKWLPLIHRT